MNSVKVSFESISIRSDGENRLLNNSSNPWLPGSVYSIRFSTPFTFSVFGFDSASLSSANAGSCVVKTTCALNEFNCFKNVTQAINLCGRTHLKLTYNTNSIIGVNAEVDIAGTTSAVIANFHQMVWST